MSTGMRKWMENGCPEIEHTPAQEMIDREELRQLRDELAQYKNERDALQAKIAEMEQQEPVAYLPLSSARILESGVIANAVVWNCRDKAASDMPLYALPGAQTQGEEK